MNHKASQFVQGARVVLLDFDGPMTVLMPPPVNAHAADAARVPLNGMDLPADVATTTDHLAILRWTANNAPQHLSAVEDACVHAEVEAARASRATPHVLDFLRWCKRVDKPVVIVSNNTADAVAVFLNRFDATGLVRGIVGREPLRPDLLKPHPSLVLAALDLAQTPAEDAVLVGDSVTDMEVARATRVRAIGYAKTPGRGRQLADAGADVIVEDMNILEK